ncbi:hypothetical protein JKP88DRAFT_203542 [Tribonema minus]|uniref:Uncharacterized protein n=1 Tax=Tribonema minus TaxID=303371 RepID=A0A835YKC3_9STRA|nr:hypothetical protein JKP88DRAFT_203542 [Tribonema minus]
MHQTHELPHVITAQQRSGGARAPVPPGCLSGGFRLGFSLSLFTLYTVPARHAPSPYLLLPTYTTTVVLLVTCHVRLTSQETDFVSVPPPAALTPSAKRGRLLSFFGQRLWVTVGVHCHRRM